VLDDIAHTIKGHGIAPRCIVLEDYRSLEDFIAIHAGDDSEPDDAEFGQQLLIHRQHLHRTLQDVTSNFLDAAVVPIDARDFFEWCRAEGRDKDAISINNFIADVAKTSPGDVMHFGGYPLPKFAFAQDTDLDLSSIAPADPDTFYLLHLRPPFLIGHYTTSKLVGTDGKTSGVFTPWPAETVEGLRSDALLTRMMEEAYTFGAPQSAAIKATEGRTVINRDKYFVPARYLVFANFAVDIPCQFVLDTAAMCLAILRTDGSGEWSQVIWLKGEVPADHALILGGMKTFITA
jgi:hypothetical protein